MNTPVGLVLTAQKVTWLPLEHTCSRALNKIYTMEVATEIDITSIHMSAKKEKEQNGQSQLQTQPAKATRKTSKLKPSLSVNHIHAAWSFKCQIQISFFQYIIVIFHPRLHPLQFHWSNFKFHVRNFPNTSQGAQRVVQHSLLLIT